MRLSVEVKKPARTSVFICRGQIVRGQECNYLFDLLTRPATGDVVLDLESVTNFDEDGLSVVLMCGTLLSATHRTLFLRNAPDGFREKLGLSQQKSTMLCGVDGVIPAVAASI